jgi:hypothetical protein
VAETYDEAVREKAERISYVRVLLEPNLSDEEIWSHWRDLTRRRPTSAFECCRSLNILATCDRLADAGVPDSALQPIRDHAYGDDRSSLHGDDPASAARGTGNGAKRQKGHP